MKNVKVVMTMTENPEWKKQLAVVKKEIAKLNKIPVCIINSQKPCQSKNL